MQAQLRVTAHSRSEAEAALAELQQQFAGRLTVTQAVMRSHDGIWSAVAHLDGGAHWYPAGQDAADHAPDIEQALQLFDATLGQEMDTNDYVDMYGFDLVGMLMREARTGYNSQAARPELYLQTLVGDVTVWCDDTTWTIRYPPAGSGTVVTAAKGQLIATLYTVMQVLLEGP
jgi:hypothetical protein